MESTAKQRLVRYLKYKGIGYNKFEKSAGLSNGYISNLKSSPGSTMLTKILYAAPDLNREWLLTGEGDMLIGDVPAISNSKGKPYYNVDFIGGFDSILNDQTTNPEYMIDFPPLNKDGVIWCNITGHSMEPQISHGDIIALREVYDWQHFLPFGEVYAIVATNELRTVKVVRKGKDNQHFLLVPINPDGFDSQEINIGHIQRIFAVLGCIKKM